MHRSVSSLVVAVAVCGCSSGPDSISSALTSAAASSGSDAGTRGSPSAEDVAACSGKAVGDACAAAYDGGDPGICQLAADGTTIYCAESDSGTGCETPSAEDIAACSGKTTGDACADVSDGGDPGTCQPAADGTTLACAEQRSRGH